MKPCNCENTLGAMGGGASRRRFAMARPGYQIEHVKELSRDVGLAKSGDSPDRNFLSRFLNLIGWIVPSAILALIPKCPLCLAGYALIGSVGFSLSTLAHVRLALIISCIASLTFLSVRYLLYVVARATAKTRP